MPRAYFSYKGKEAARNAAAEPGPPLALTPAPRQRRKGLKAELRAGVAFLCLAGRAKAAPKVMPPTLRPAAGMSAVGPQQGLSPLVSRYVQRPGGQTGQSDVEVRMERRAGTEFLRVGTVARSDIR